MCPQLSRKGRTWEMRASRVHCMVQTCLCGRVHQGPTLGASQIDSQKLAQDFTALVEVWTKVSGALKAAVMAIVRSVGNGTD